MHAVGFGPYRKIEIEEADSSCSGQKEYDFVVPFHGGLWSGHAVLGRRSLDGKMVS